MKQLFKLSAMLLVLTFVFVNCGGGPSGPKELVKESFTMMEENDQAGLKDMLSSDVKAMVDDKKLEEGMTKQYESIKEKGGIANIEFLEEDIQEQEANFKVKLTYGDESTKTEKVKLVKEEGDWKLGVAK